MAIKSPEARRLSKLQWAVAGTWLATGFGLLLATAGMIADSDGKAPEHRGLREANHTVPLVFVAVAVVWFVTLLPALPTPLRITTLRRCRVLLWVTVGAWLVWTMVRASPARR